MRIIYIGSVYFSRVILEKLIELSANVVGVICKEHSAFNSDFEDLTALAHANNIPSIYVQNINTISSLEWMRGLKADVIFCFGWSNLIKKDILNLCPLGVIGFHPALLPNNRGRHPLIWAKVLGLSTSGTSFFFMDEGADTGDLLDQKEFQIMFEDTASTIYQKMIDNALEQVEMFLPKLQSGCYRRVKQNKNGNNWRRREMVDGLIDFRMTSEAICNLVRALTKPYAGAHCIFNGVEIKIWEVEIDNCEFQNLEPGKVLELIGDYIKVKTYNGAILIKSHEFLTIPQIGSYII